MHGIAEPAKGEGPVPSTSKAAAEQQACELGPLIGAELAFLGPFSSGTIPDSARKVAEARLGTDFSGVRLDLSRTGQQRADEHNAQAMAEGSLISFGAAGHSRGARQQGTLLGHELVHVAQQRLSGSSLVQRARGDCTDEEHRELQDAVDTYCKQRPRSCSQSMSASELEERITNNAACIAARMRINAKCFRGGDPGHQQAVDIATNALMNCHRVLERVRVPVLHREPLVQPETIKRLGISAAIGSGIGLVLGAIIGGVGGAAGGTLVAPGFGTVGGAIGGGTAGAVKGAAIGGIAGAAVGVGLQALWDWATSTPTLIVR